ncbi:hypothetical protein ES703_44264 [subsurface metagenome]
MKWEPIFFFTVPVSSTIIQPCEKILVTYDSQYKNFREIGYDGFDIDTISRLRRLADEDHQL